jgi:hypothetical protein
MHLKKGSFHLVLRVPSDPIYKREKRSAHVKTRRAESTRRRFFAPWSLFSCARVACHLPLSLSLSLLIILGLKKITSLWMAWRGAAAALYQKRSASLFFCEAPAAEFLASSWARKKKHKTEREREHSTFRISTHSHNRAALNFKILVCLHARSSLWLYARLQGDNNIKMQLRPKDFIYILQRYSCTMATWYRRASTPRADSICSWFCKNIYICKGALQFNSSLFCLFYMHIYTRCTSCRHVSNSNFKLQ